MKPAPAEESVIVGRVLGPWGVKGWLQIYSYTDPREGIFAYSPWFIEGISEPVTPLEHKRVGKRLVVKLSKIDTPEEARAWAHKVIAVMPEQLPPLPEGEFYWRDLIGLQVINRQGHTLGRVNDMLSTGANDVMEVASSHSSQSILIPFIQGVYVDRVSIPDQQMVVDWPIEWLTDQDTP